MWISNSHKFGEQPHLDEAVRKMVRALDQAEMNAPPPPTFTITTTTANSYDPSIIYNPSFRMVEEVPPMPIDDFSPSRTKAFEDRGYLVRWAVEPAEKLFSLFIRNMQLGQGFVFYFNSHAELMQWASSNPTVKPKRIVRRFFEAEGLGFTREDEMEVKDSEHVDTMLSRMEARYRKYGELEPIAPPVEEKPRELKFERMVELDIP